MQEVRVFSDGVYDGFHRGHARQLRQAKEMFPDKKVYLIAGVCGQEDVEKFKGPTVFPGEERKEMVEHCRWVDEVIYPSPWIIDEEFLTKNRIDFVCHDDDPYATAGVDDAYKLCKDLGKFRATKRTEGISTTDMIRNIIRDREGYILRNLRRGVKRSDMNVGWLSATWIKFKAACCRRN